MFRTFLLLALCVLASPLNAQTRGARPGPHDNVLLIIGDDFGREKLAAYGVHPEPASTPTLDLMSEYGVTFERFYSQPVCSPTRAAMLTGRQAFRTGISTGVPWLNCENSANGCFAWDVDGAKTLAEALRPTHFPAAFGKWHLGLAEGGRGYMHPIRAGFGLFMGAKQNLGIQPSAFFEWEKNVATPEGALQTISRNYATSENVDDTLQFVRRMQNKPWFAWLAFNTAHAPFHAPPQELTPNSQLDAGSSSADKAKAMVESMDTEIGRLLKGIRPDVLSRTWIIFLADNGPAGTAVQPPYPSAFKAKPEPWEGNINMPMVVVGPGLVAPGRMTDHLVHAVDIFATVCEMAGAPVAEEAVDSISFLDVLLDPSAPPLRDVVLSERKLPNGPGPATTNRFAVTDGRWKWGRLGEVDFSGPTQSFYDLLNDPNETNNLFGTALSDEQADALQHLRDRRNEILASHGGGL